MDKIVEIVDRGRGPQLSTSRITVQDVLPYYREGTSNEEIRRWIPSLTDEEIVLLKNYIQVHQEEVLQAEARIKAFHDCMRAAQHAKGGVFAEGEKNLTAEERVSRLKEKIKQRQAEKNGARNPR
jgi:uncharacterized protein (DUF433 family)